MIKSYLASLWQCKGLFILCLASVGCSQQFCGLDTTLQSVSVNRWAVELLQLGNLCLLHFWSW